MNDRHAHFWPSGPLRAIEDRFVRCEPPSVGLGDLQGRMSRRSEREGVSATTSSGPRASPPARDKGGLPDDRGAPEHVAPEGSLRWLSGMSRRGERSRSDILYGNARRSLEVDPRGAEQQ